jgi:hypothetical protein
MQTLAEAWNGKSWTVETTQTPPNTLGALLSAVSCSSASFCAAVGYMNTSPTNEGAIADLWNGTSWVEYDAPNIGTGTELEGISCTTSTSCIATGAAEGSWSGPLAVLEAWNGSTWAMMRYEMAGDNLEAISCSLSTSCVAVGSSGVAEVWNGSRWEMHKVHLVSTDTNVVLAGVSCLAPTSCVGVGWYDHAAAEKTLAEGWTGTAWKYEMTRW